MHMRCSPPPNTSLFTPKYFSNFNYLFYGFCDSGVILKELGQNLSFSVKSEVLKRGEPPHIRNKNMKIQKFVT